MVDHHQTKLRDEPTSFTDLHLNPGFGEGDVSGLILSIHPEDDKRSVCARGRLIERHVEILMMGNIFHYSPPRA